jgi:hypothetical protein
MIENVLAKDINGLEPRLTRQGYNAKVLAELLNAKPREIRSFLLARASLRKRSSIWTDWPKRLTSGNALSLASGGLRQKDNGGKPRSRPTEALSAF